MVYVSFASFTKNNWIKPLFNILSVLTAIFVKSCLKLFVS